MKSLVVTGPGEVLLVERKPLKLKEGSVRIRMVVSALCGSDIRNFLDPKLTPQTLGHEFSGYILEVSGRSKFHVGQRVTAFPMVSCLKCAECLGDNHRDCAHKKGVGFQIPGSFAEEIVLDSRFVIPLSDNVSYEQGALVECFSCAYRMVQEICSLKSVSKNERILILGDGPIALSNVQLLRSYSFKNITLIGKHSRRMELALSYGADKVVCVDSISELVGGKAYDLCVFSAPPGDLLGPLVSLIIDKGKIFSQVRLQSKSALLLMKDKKIELYRAFAYLMSDFYRVMELVSNKKIIMEDMITHREPLSRCAKLFNNFLDKSNRIKTLIKNDISNF
jgi:threonine dehydrogenase-like Zn-dependent dehydrogenase